MVNKTTIASLAIIAVLLVGVAAMGVQLYLPKTGNTVATVPSSGTSGSAGTNPMNIFNGKITNAQVSPGEIIGFTSYDANCVGSQITQCDAGIKTDQYGELNFHYQHDMNAQPCLHMFGSEKVIVDILDLQGNARITRTIDASSMGMH
jgi:hypothetical protein